MIKEKILIDYTDSFTYVGKGSPNSTETSPSWSVMRIENDSLGRAISITYSGGTIEPIYVWNDRENLEYK